MAKKNNKSKKASGVEPFESEDEINDNGDNDNEQEDEVAKESAKAKARRAREDEDANDDDDDDDDEVEDSAADEDEDDADEEDTDDEEDDEYSQFKPFIVHEDQEWELDEVLTNADGGEIVTLYHLESGHWYKLQPIKVGEVAAP